jgi:hypothetical protein
MPTTWVVWVTTGVVLCLVALWIAVGMPWAEVGSVVANSELPRTRLLRSHTSKIEEARRIAVDARGGYWFPSRRPTRGPSEDPEDTIREALGWRGEEEPPGWHPVLIVRAHRLAKWSSVFELLRAADRAGRASVYLELGSWRYLLLVLAAPSSWSKSKSRAGSPEYIYEHITIRSAPLEDGAGIRSAFQNRVEEAWAADRILRPIIHLRLTDDPVVEDVLHALECYTTAEHHTVYLSPDDS